MAVPGSDFDEFVVSSSSRLLRVAVALTGDRVAAEDLLQDVLERMYVGWRRIEDPPSYARRALANASSNRWRRRGRRPEHLRAELPDAGVDDSTGSHDNRDQIIRALMQLPARQRAAIVLRYLEDLTEAETAEVLGCSLGTVKSQTSRALDRLRAIVDDGNHVGHQEVDQ